MPDWLELLKAEIAHTSITKTAQRLAFGRSTISMVVSGKYPAKTDEIAAQVRRVLGRVKCPYQEKELSTQECQRIAGLPRPQGNPSGLRQWVACQGCVNNQEVKHAA